MDRPRGTSIPLRWGGGIILQKEDLQVRRPVLHRERFPGLWEPSGFLLFTLLLLFAGFIFGLPAQHLGESEERDQRHCMRLSGGLLI